MRRLTIDPAVLERFPAYMAADLYAHPRSVFEQAASELAERIRRITPECTLDVELLGNPS